MIEKEIIIEDVNKKEIKDKLRKIKAKLIFSGTQTDRVFDFRNKKLWNSKPRSCVRIRTEGKEVIINFWSEMKSNSSIKQRGHSEFVTESLKDVLDFLKNIGMRQIFPIKRKNVERYEKDKIIFELKTSKGKTDLEIEASSKKKILEGKRRVLG